MSTRASIVNVGGFRPTGDPLATHFGLRPLGLPDERWPTLNDAPLLFVCQLNLRSAPAVPELLLDIALLTFFVNPELDVMSKTNGEDWCLRTYPSLDGLVPLVAPANARPAKRGFECRWEEGTDSPRESKNIARTKIGGYPTTVQSEPWWDYQEHAAAPAYVLQIASETKAGVAWGDGGILYLARGTAPGCTGQWFLDSQSY